MIPRGFITILMVTVLPASAAEAQNQLQTNSNEYLSSFNSSMAIVIVFLLSAFFLMVFFSIYLRRCAVISAAPPYSSRPRQGLDQSTIDSFPIVNQGNVVGQNVWNSVECAICLGEFRSDETLRLIPNCSHVFHSECIDAWLTSHVTCPVCRRKLQEPRETTAFEEMNNVVRDEVAINVNNELIGRRSLARSHSAGHSPVATRPLTRCSTFNDNTTTPLSSRPSSCLPL